MSDRFLFSVGSASIVLALSALATILWV